MTKKIEENSLNVILLSDRLSEPTVYFTDMTWRLVILMEMMLEVVDMEVDKVAAEVADMMEDMEVNKVANMAVKIPF